MDEDSIEEIVNEVISGDDKNLGKLKKIVSYFFKGKEQKDFDKIEKNKLVLFIKLEELLRNKKRLNEIDRGFLDYFYNRPMKKFNYYEFSGEVNENKMRKAIREIYSSNLLGKANMELTSFIGWILIEENYWDDIELFSDKNDFYMKLCFTDVNAGKGKPEMSLFLLGDYRGLLFDNLKNILEKD